MNQILKEKLKKLDLTVYSDAPDFEKATLEILNHYSIAYNIMHELPVNKELKDIHNLLILVSDSEKHAQLGDLIRSVADGRNVPMVAVSPKSMDIRCACEYSIPPEAIGALPQLLSAVCLPPRCEPENMEGREKGIIEKNIVKIFNATTDLFFVVSDKYEYLDFMVSTASPLALPEEIILGVTIDSLPLARDLINRIKSKIDYVLESANPARIEYSMRVLNTNKNYLNRIYKIDDNKVFVHVVDNDEYQNRIDVLEKKEGLYREMVENSPSIFMKLDSKGYIQYVNNSGAEILGYTPEQLQNKSFVQTLMPGIDSDGRDQQTLFHNLLQMPEDNMKEDIRHLSRHKHVIWITWTATKKVTKYGTTEFVFIGIDRTGEKKAQRKIQESYAQGARFQSAFNRILRERNTDHNRQMKYILMQTSEAIKTLYAGLWLLSEETGNLEPVTLFINDENRFTNKAVSLSQNIFSHFTGSQLLAVYDTGSSPVMENFSQVQSSLNLKSFIASCIKTRGNNTGLLILGNEIDTKYWSTQEINFVYSVAEIISHELDAKLHSVGDSKEIKFNEDIVDTDKSFVEIVDNLIRIDKQGIAIVNLQQEFVLLNDAFCKILGYQKSELKGKHYSTIIPENIEADIRENVHARIAAGQVINKQMPLKSKNGELIDIRFRNDFLRWPSGSSNTIIIIQPSDIAKTGDDWIGTSKLILNQSGSASIILDSNGEPLIITEKVYKFFGIEHSEYFMPGAEEINIAIYDKLKDKNSWIDLKAYAVNQQLKVETFEYKLYNGLVLSGIIAPIVREDSSYMGCAMFMNNISDTIEHNKNMLQTIEEANAAIRIKDNFLANISHEIRTPMNSIMGYAQVLASQLESKKLLNYVNIILNSGNQLIMLLNDLLDLSKLESGTLTLNMTEMYPQKLLSEIKDLFGPKAEEKNLDLITEIKDGFPFLIMMDETRLRQVIWHLLSNAIKFTDNGFIRLTLGAEDIAKSGPGTINIILTVEDSGIGIPADDIDNIFNKFFQHSSSSTRHHAGIGIGLALIKKLVDKMNGTISVESKPGNGACFTIRFAGIGASDYGNYTDKDDLEEVQFDMPVQDNTLTNADDLLEILNNLMSEWDSVSKSQVIGDTKKFADKLRKIANDFNYESLKEYTGALLKQINDFEFDKFPKTLARFPDILNMIKKYL